MSICTLSTFLLRPGEEGLAICLSLTPGWRLCHSLQSEALIDFLTWLYLCRTISHSFHPLFTHSLKASSALHSQQEGVKEDAHPPQSPKHYQRTYKLHPHPDLMIGIVFSSFVLILFQPTQCITLCLLWVKRSPTLKEHQKHLSLIHEWPIVGRKGIICWEPRPRAFRCLPSSSPFFPKDFYDIYCLPSQRIKMVKVKSN